MPGACEHVPVYAGVVNLRARGEPVGFVDVWRCTKCGMMFAEERRYPPKEDYSIGFREPKGTLSIAICSSGESYEWALIDAFPGASVECGGCRIRVGEGLSVEADGCRARLVGVSDALNRNLEIAEV